MTGLSVFSQTKNSIISVLRTGPHDIVFGLSLLVAAQLAVFYQLGPEFQVIVGIPLLLFLPGYALVLILYPNKDYSGPSLTSVGSGTKIQWRPKSVSATERLALSFGISLALLPILGVLILGFGQPVDGAGIVAIFSVLVAGGLFAGEYRRRKLPTNERFDFPTEEIGVTIDSWASGTQFDRALTLGLVLVVVVSLTGLTYALVVPNNGEAYTSMSLLTQTSGGEFVATDYPSTVQAAGETGIFVRVHNFERQSATYTLVVESQQVDTSAEEAVILDRTEVYRASQTLDQDEMWTVDPAIDSALTGENVRLTYYLYKDGAPEEPTTESAYRTGYVWVTVTDGGQR
jgi:uncharacterized membrane protein